jgi:hypothetical protein
MFHRLLDLLFGCRHKRTTRPITPVKKTNGIPNETYVSCLECGKRLSYDLATMKNADCVPVHTRNGARSIPASRPCEGLTKEYFRTAGKLSKAIATPTKLPPGEKDGAFKGWRVHPPSFRGWQ